MATELRPGVMTGIFTRLAVEGNTRTRVALEPLATLIEGQAKRNASSGSHAYGTPTPAFRGSGPAVISGTLRRAVTHTPVTATSDGWETKVGMAVGFYAPYGRGRTSASLYASFLETGLRNGATYPFLGPAFKFAMGYPAKLIYDAAYGKSWKML